jgi:hypothetical protein
MTDAAPPIESDPRNAILAEARRLAVDALYSEKGHFEAASGWRGRNYWLGVPAALIGATAGATILADMDPAVGGSLALVGAAITALMTFLNPSERAAQHHRSGVSYGVLRRALRQFIQIDVQMMDDAALRARLSELTEKIGALQAESLPIPSGAHKKAFKSIQGGSAEYTTEELALAGG